MLRLAVLLALAAWSCDAQRIFTIQGNDFYKDGKPFRIVAGEMHYWRAVPEDWMSRLRMIKLLGCNTLTVYVDWALHEPQKDQFTITPQTDFVKIIQMADSLGLLVIARVGPYITAETDFGGFPYWLTTEPGLQLRRPNAPYYARIDKFFDFVIPKLVPLQYSKGGPIIDFQIEDDTDVPVIPLPDSHAYYGFLRDGLRKRGVDTLINVLAFAFDLSLQKASVPGCWIALEFSVADNTQDCFNKLRKAQPNGPLMVLEYYPAWFDLEGDKHKTMDSAVFANAVDGVLRLNASISFYMAFGGTNFGFSNGADMPLFYRAVTTSYDYDAMIIESGDAHPTKFKAVRDVIARYLPVPTDPIPPPSPKGNYGAVNFTQVAPLLSSLPLFANVSSASPMGMEALSQAYGYVLYQTQLANFTSPQRLQITKLQDRALVYVDGSLRGAVGWAEPNPLVELTLQPASRPNPRLEILVENKGRCSGEVVDFGCAQKGISGTVRLGSQLLQAWTNVKLPMTNIDKTAFRWQPYTQNANLPVFYQATLTLPSSPAPLHSFLQTDGWGHGFVLVNGFNIGRFSGWGPQRSMYVPASVLKTGANSIIVFESDQIDPLDVSRGLKPFAVADGPRQMVFSDQQRWK